MKRNICCRASTQFCSLGESRSHFSLKSTLGYKSSFQSSAPAFTLAQVNRGPSYNQLLFHVTHSKTTCLDHCTHISITGHDLGVRGPAVSQPPCQKLLLGPGFGQSGVYPEDSSFMYPNLLFLSCAIAVCVYTYVHIQLSDVGITACSLEFLPVSTPGWLKRWTKEAGYLPQLMGNSAVQFAVVSLQSRAGGLCSIKLLVTLLRVSEISSFSSSPGKPLSPGPEQSQVSGPIISMREMSFLLQPLSRHKCISCLDVYCHSSPFTLLHPFPQAVQERKKKKPVTLLKLSASPVAGVYPTEDVFPLQIKSQLHNSVGYNKTKSPLSKNVPGCLGIS